MRLLIISKNLLDQKDAQSQQTLAFIEALQKICEHIDVITAETTNQERNNLRCLEEKNIKIYALPARWVNAGERLIDKIKRKLHRNLMATLVTKWARRAGMVASNLNEKNNYSGIITIGLPIESHMAAIGLRDKSKWIAHFSDPWPESLMPKPYSDYSIPIINRLQKINVQRIISKANLVSFTCEQSRELFAKYYNFKFNKTFVVPHVAPDSLKPIKRQDGKFIITYAGSLSRERFFPEFFHAVKKLPKDTRVIIQFVGNVHSSARRLINELGIQDHFIFAGQLSRGEVFFRMRESDALLLIEAKMEKYPFLPSKMADYSALELPICAITGVNSAAAEIISRAGFGVVAGHSEIEVTSAIIEIVRQAAASGLRNNLIADHFRKERVQNILIAALRQMADNKN